MDSEQREFAASKAPARFLAMRFAAKEAIVKALGTGFRHGMWVRDSGVRHDPLGRPEIIFSPRGKAACAAAGVSGGYLSLTDEAGLVVATAILVSGSAGRKRMSAKLILDIETVPDPEIGRGLYGLEDLDDGEVMRAMLHHYKQRTGLEFLPPIQHKVVAIAVVLRNEEGVRPLVLGKEDAEESDLIARFFRGFRHYVPDRGYLERRRLRPSRAELPRPAPRNRGQGVLGNRSERAGLPLQ